MGHRHLENEVAPRENSECGGYPGCEARWIAMLGRRWTARSATLTLKWSSLLRDPLLILSPLGFPGSRQPDAV